MDRSYEYTDEDEYEEGLTFAKVGHFLKKGWLRMLIFTLGFALVALIIALPIKTYYHSEYVGQTSIEYIYDGVEKGLDPNGGTLNTDNVISTRVLSDAVKAAELDGVITEISSLRERMRVVGVESEEYKKLVSDAASGNAEAQTTLRTYSMYPTRFDIIISEPGELGLTDNQVKLLLDKVVSSYYNDFKARYSVSNMFASDLYNLSDNIGMWEYVDIYDVYTQALSPISEHLTALNKKHSTFTSSVNNSNFALLLSELETLRAGYDRFSDYVITNDIWRNKEVALKSISEQKTRLEKEIESLDKLAEQMKAQLDSIQPNQIIVTTGSGSQTTTSYPQEYWNYHEQYSDTIKEISQKNDQLSVIVSRLNSLEASGAEAKADDEKLATALAELKSLEQKSTVLVAKINNTITDFYDTTIIASSVRQPIPSMVMRMSSDFNIVIIIVVAAIVGLLVACVMTGVKISKANARAKQTGAAAPEKDEDAKADEEEAQTK